MQGVQCCTFGKNATTFAIESVHAARISIPGSKAERREKHNVATTKP